MTGKAFVRTEVVGETDINEDSNTNSNDNSNNNSNRGSNERPQGYSGQQKFSKKK